MQCFAQGGEWRAKRLVPKGRKGSESGHMSAWRPKTDVHYAPFTGRYGISDYRVGWQYHQCQGENCESLLTCRWRTIDLRNLHITTSPQRSRPVGLSLPASFPTGLRGELTETVSVPLTWNSYYILPSTYNPRANMARRDFRLIIWTCGGPP